MIKHNTVGNLKPEHFGDLDYELSGENREAARFVTDAIGRVLNQAPDMHYSNPHHTLTGSSLLDIYDREGIRSDLDD